MTDINSFFSANIANIGARLDLATEVHQLLKNNTTRQLVGIHEHVDYYPQAKVTIIDILDRRGECLMGKKIGSYITIESPGIRENQNLLDQISPILAQYLAPLLPADPDKNILLIGIGNNHATPDALGPLVVDTTLATRHIMTYAAQELHDELRPFCTLAPGVLGVTGIETAEIIKGVVEHIEPACIIVVDSLAAANIERVASTIQITNSGISPGSGIGNRRLPINSDTMGVPVVAIGVPMVINTDAIIYESLEGLQQYWRTQGYGQIPPVDGDAISAVSRTLLHNFQGSLMVTPKDIDQLVKNIARIIAAGIAQAVHPGVNKENYHLYIN